MKVDKVLEALRYFRENATPEQKKEAIEQLEKDCKSETTCEEYISSVGQDAFKETPPTYEEFRQEILDEVDNAPKEWRRGQSVFNIIETNYGYVARMVQFDDKVDCFYDDSLIEAFMLAVYKRLPKARIGRDNK